MVQNTSTTVNGVTRQLEQQRNSFEAKVDLESGGPHPSKKPSHHIPSALKRFADRFLRRGKRQIGVYESLYNIATSSFLNWLIVFLPISWALHFCEEQNHQLIFAFSFLAIVPLERLFDYCGEQMAFYCGKDLSDLIIITLNNSVEATLAIILLLRNDFRVLQATIIGVIILHLLLIPGTAFLTGGMRVESQELAHHVTELNHTLLTMGVLSLILPAAFFAALDRGVNANTGSAGEAASGLLTDEMRGRFLSFSRGMAVFLLVMYICSRIYLHDPPGDDNALQPRTDLSEAFQKHEEELAHGEPEVNQWVCIVVIVVAVGLMAVTAEFLVESIEYVKESLGGGGHEEWFGLILLPVVSFAADGAVAILYFFSRLIYDYYFKVPIPSTWTNSLAKARAIDLSIQFSLFWMPVLILLAWWTRKPLSLLFDLFEVVILVGGCFLVNYVTADKKTNWAEGAAMVSFYAMIALCAWYYPGQPEVELFLTPGSIAELLANSTSVSSA